MRGISMRKLLMAAALAMVTTLVACGGGGGDSGSPPTTEEPPLMVETITAEEAAKWPEAWCANAPGVARADLVSAMGQPTTETTQDLAWVGFGYALYAFLDVSGNVYQMDVNSGAVDCEPSRRLPST